MSVQAIPAFQDNYLWLLSRAGLAAAVDPGDADPILDALREQELRLGAILITHHHADHIGGVQRLRQTFPDAKVYGPDDARVPATVRVREGDTVRIPALRREFRVLEVPGHTRSHIAYWGEGDLFCGDTLFVSGCGRLFEGTSRQMQNSLSKLRALPAETCAYCAHEYTLDNMEFASWVEPDNGDLQKARTEAQERRRRGVPTVPSTIGQELRCNPFLRYDHPDVIEAARRRAGRTDLQPHEVFGEIRHWKDAEFD